MKKTRQRTHRPVSRRGKQTQRQYRDLKKQMRDPTLRSRWNNRSSTSRNLQNFSLKDFEGRLADEEQLAKKRPYKPLNERELVLLHALHAKYGDDVQAMIRDQKLNLYQWTSTQCEKLLQLYKQRHVCSSAKQYLLPQMSHDAAAPAAAASSPRAARATPAAAVDSSSNAATAARAAASSPRAAAAVPDASSASFSARDVFPPTSAPAAAGATTSASSSGRAPAATGAAATEARPAAVASVKPKKKKQKIAKSALLAKRKHSSRAPA